jgi:hypothetical protein
MKKARRINVNSHLTPFQAQARTRRYWKLVVTLFERLASLRALSGRLEPDASRSVAACTRASAPRLPRAAAARSGRTAANHHKYLKLQDVFSSGASADTYK